MSSNLAALESFSFKGENIGTAGAVALRKVKSLSESAPKGRLFAAIATLSELSAEATQALQAGNHARAVHVATEMAKPAESLLPSFFRKRA